MSVSSARASRSDYNELGVDNNTTEIFEGLEMLTQVVANRNINSLIVNGSLSVLARHTLCLRPKQRSSQGRDYVVLKCQDFLGLYMTCF